MISDYLNYMAGVTDGLAYCTMGARALKELTLLAAISPTLILQSLLREVIQSLVAHLGSMSENRIVLHGTSSQGLVF